MSYIAIIPCRKNSKGIKNKNIKIFAKKPLLYWTIKSALQTPQISKVYITSDSDRIIKLSKNFGAETIKRPKEFATDTSTSESAILHALKKIQTNAKNVVFLQATSPLRKKNDISNAIKIFEKKRLDSLFSSFLANSTYIWKDFRGNLKNIEQQKLVRKSRQSYKNKYQENGSIYIFKKNKFLKKKNRFFGKVGTYVMNKKYSFEIDTREDFNILKIVSKYLKKI